MVKQPFTNPCWTRHGPAQPSQPGGMQTTSWRAWGEGCLSIYFSPFITISWENISQGLSCPSCFLSHVPLKPTSSLLQQQGENNRERGGRLSTSTLFLHLCREGQDGSGGDSEGGFVRSWEPAALLLLLTRVPTSRHRPAPGRKGQPKHQPQPVGSRIVPSPLSAAGEEEVAESSQEHPYSRGGKDAVMVRGHPAAEGLHSHGPLGCTLKVFALTEDLQRHNSPLSCAWTRSFLLSLRWPSSHALSEVHLDLLFGPDDANLGAEFTPN